LERGTERNLTGGESLDQDHWTATDWTSPHRNWLGGDRCASGCRSGRYIGQELFAKRHEFTPPAFFILVSGVSPTESNLISDE
jgi:hypothetical protein